MPRLITRREWLWMSAAAPLARVAAHSDRQQRIARIIGEYERQGDHRTGTDVDRRSAEWLANEVRLAGLTPTLERFTFSRVDPLSSFIEVNGRHIEGLPLFDGGFTDAGGVRGRLGPLGGGSEIGMAETAPNTAGAGRLGDARRTGHHQAIVCVTRGARAGLCPSNADAFLTPFGPPVVQIASADAAFLTEAAQASAAVQAVAHVNRTTSDALNVTTMLAADNRSLPPLVVMTPRSGWWRCASERGGGIACWLELMRALTEVRLQRSVAFVASSGHEIGHLGINAFVDGRPGVVSTSAGWIHLGANIGAAQDAGTTIQASSDDTETMLAEAIVAAGLTVTRRNPRGTVPGGEAEVVHRGGGRYVSVIGRNALFHNPGDFGGDAVDVAAIDRFVDAFANVARSLAR